MEIIKLLALLIGSAIIFACCTAHPSPNLSYQEKAFRAHIFWQTEDISIGAVITSLPSLDPEQDEARSITLEFTAPESLLGITVCKSGGEVTASLDGMEISAPHAERWLAIAELFDIEATVKESSIETLDGQKLNFIRAVSDDGKEFSLYLFPASGLPRRICSEINGSPCTLEVISFEFIPD